MYFNNFFAEFSYNICLYCKWQIARVIRIFFHNYTDFVMKGLTLRLLIHKTIKKIYLCMLITKNKK